MGCRRAVIVSIQSPQIAASNPIASPVDTSLVQWASSRLPAMCRLGTHVVHPVISRLPFVGVLVAFGRNVERVFKTGDKTTHWRLEASPGSMNESTIGDEARGDHY